MLRESVESIYRPVGEVIFDNIEQLSALLHEVGCMIVGALAWAWAHQCYLTLFTPLFTAVLTCFYVPLWTI